MCHWQKVPSLKLTVRPRKIGGLGDDPFLSGWFVSRNYVSFTEGCFFLPVASQRVMICQTGFFHPRNQKNWFILVIHRILVNSTFLQNFKDQLGHQLGCKISGRCCQSTRCYVSMKIPVVIVRAPWIFQWKVKAKLEIFLMSSFFVTSQHPWIFLGNSPNLK